MSFHPSLNLLPEIIPMTAGGAAKNGINISLKNCNRAFIVCKNQPWKLIPCWIAAA